MLTSKDLLHESTECSARQLLTVGSWAIECGHTEYATCPGSGHMGPGWTYMGPSMLPMTEQKAGVLRGLAGGCWALMVLCGVSRHCDGCWCLGVSCGGGLTCLTGRLTICYLFIIKRGVCLLDCLGVCVSMSQVLASGAMDAGG